MLWRRPQGNATWREGDDGKVTREHDTVRCGHCGFIAAVPVGCVPGDKCTMCNFFVCERCAPIPMCRPYELHVQAIESRHAFVKAVGIDSIRGRDAKRVFKLFEERKAFDEGRLRVVNGIVIPGSEVVARDAEFERQFSTMRVPVTG